eukprot:m.1260659 g.1260659  ORF g.1260659 m.1260659 type:complete len:67 (+) comp24728_c0_seq9:129-329(+)
MCASTTTGMENLDSWRALSCCCGMGDVYRTHLRCVCALPLDVPSGHACVIIVQFDAAAGGSVESGN